MRRYLLTESRAHSQVINTPNTRTATDTCSMTCGVMTFSSSGSLSTSQVAAPHRMPSPKAAANTPVQKLRPRNGRRMKLQLAPTSFMVWMRKRLE